MTTAASVVPSLDPETVLANLSIIILAVAAVIAGVWKGWQEIKKSVITKQEGDRLVAAIPVATAETYILQSLAREIENLRDEVVDLRRCTAEHTHELTENRRAIVATSENMLKLTEALNNFNR